MLGRALARRRDRRHRGAGRQPAFANGCCRCWNGFAASAGIAIAASRCGRVRRRARGRSPACASPAASHRASPRARPARRSAFRRWRRWRKNRARRASSPASMRACTKCIIRRSRRRAGRWREVMPGAVRRARGACRCRRARAGSAAATDLPPTGRWVCARVMPDIHPTAIAVARLAAPRLAAGEGVDAALAVAGLRARQGRVHRSGAKPAMSAVLKDAPRLAAMREADLAEVLAIESAIYSHPWTRGNFADSLRAGYQCWTWRRGAELVGYFVLLVAAGEGAPAEPVGRRRAPAQRPRQRAARGSDAPGARARRAAAVPRGAPEQRAARRRSTAASAFAQVAVRPGYYPAHGGREDALGPDARAMSRRDEILKEMGLAPVWRLRSVDAVSEEIQRRRTNRRQRPGDGLDAAEGEGRRLHRLQAARGLHADGVRRRRREGATGCWSARRRARRRTGWASPSSARRASCSTTCWPRSRSAAARTSTSPTC